MFKQDDLKKKYELDIFGKRFKTRRLPISPAIC